MEYRLLEMFIKLPGWNIDSKCKFKNQAWVITLITGYKDTLLQKSLVSNTQAYVLKLKVFKVSTVKMLMVFAIFVTVLAFNTSVPCVVYWTVSLTSALTSGFRPSSFTRFIMFGLIIPDGVYKHCIVKIAPSPYLVLSLSLAPSVCCLLVQK